MVGTYATNWCLLKVEGIGNDPTANSAATGKGGLVWIKGRSNVGHGTIFDTERGVGNFIMTSLANAQASSTAGTRLTAFNSNGFSLGTDPGSALNFNGYTYASWTFRKQPGFFDIVTYTGTGSPQTISHNLGTTPGMVIVKNLTDSATNWMVYHRGSNGGTNPEQYSLLLNSTSAQAAISGDWNDTAPTSTQFTVGNQNRTNGSGDSFVAYLFAHDDQRFGTDSDESIIKCGSYTGTGASGNFQNLGWEPQYVLVKSASASGNWIIHDVMRGMSETTSYTLKAESSQAENLDTPGRLLPRPTGFEFSSSGLAANNASGVTYIYVAIRRPHKPAEEFAATDLFDVIARSGTGSATTIDSINFAPDAFLTKRRNDTQHWPFSARLTGNNYIYLSDSAAEGTGKHINATGGWGYQDKVAVTADADVNASGGTYINYFFKRAKGFFDVVTYTGDGSSSKTISHNLGVVPEIILFRGRGAEAWWMYSAEMAATEFLVTYLNNEKYTGRTYFNSTRPTASSWNVKGPSSAVNGNGDKYIAYLFASVPGIAKFGSYTGNGTTTNNIDCGFSSGARFVVVKRIDSTGNWYVWDTERGIVAGNDPKLYFSSTGSEITSADEIDPYSAGFTISSSSVAINASGGTYLFLAIA
jgi:hypothetical protein